MTEQHSGLPVLAFAHLAALETWFGSQPSDAPGVWIKFAKKGALKATLTNAEAIDAALCHGWIDGRLEKYNDTHWLVRFTPRRSASKWSLKNRKRALKLMEQGRMQPVGLAQIDAAIADRRWDQAYASASGAQVPSDLQSALNANPTAAAFFKTLSSRNRYAILYRISAVKKTETRSERSKNSWPCLSVVRRYMANRGTLGTRPSSTFSLFRNGGRNTPPCTCHARSPSAPSRNRPA